MQVCLRSLLRGLPQFDSGGIIVKPFTIVMLVILVALIAAMIVLYFLGKKTEKKREEQEAQLAAAAQQVNMLIIDKKRMRMKDAGLPSMVMEQTPKRYQRAKIPVVKAKVGPRVMTLIAADEIFEQIPLKMEVKATVSGIYITAVRGLRGPLPKVEEKKKGLRAKITGLYNSSRAKIKEINEQEEAEKASKKKK